MRVPLDWKLVPGRACKEPGIKDSCHPYVVVRDATLHAEGLACAY